MNSTDPPLASPFRPTTVAERPSDVAASRIATAVARHFRDISANGGPRRSFAHEMVIGALLLCATDMAAPDDGLARIVAVHRRTGVRTKPVVAKCASEARAILHYGAGVADAASLVSPRTEDELPGAIAVLDRQLVALRPRDAIERRAHELAGRRGGRPHSRTFRVLSAVAMLRQSAEQGDIAAETELRLVRSLLGGESV